MNLKKVLPFSHDLLKKVVFPGDTVLDGTCGNGHDTLLLAELVGKNGHVYAFDIQKSAITSTANRLSEQDQLAQVTLINDSHTMIKKHLSEPLKAAIFNLGYLPGGDKTITTTGETTITSIEQVLDILLPGGLLILVIYYGHPAGKIEKEQIIKFMRQLPQEAFHVLEYKFINQRNDPPFAVVVEKR